MMLVMGARNLNNGYSSGCEEFDMIIESASIVWRLSRYLCAIAFVVMSSGAHAQPPPPDPIFRHGFESPNQPPVADAGDNHSVSVGTPLVIDGSASFDPDGDPLEFAWRIAERPTGSGAQVFDGDQIESVLIPDRAGVYVVQLVVFDGELFSSPATTTITATGSLSPAATIGASGGAVGLPDGSGVLIPPGALPSATLIGIGEIPPSNGTLPPHAVPVSAVYRLSPSGQSFDKPVQIIIPYDANLLPKGYDEGAISMFRQGGEPGFHMVGSEYGDDDPRTDGQVLDVVNRRISIRYDIFSDYRAVAARGSVGFSLGALAVSGASVSVYQPPQLRTERPNHHLCKRRVSGQTIDDYSQGNLGTRAEANIQAIIIHSTNNGNVRRNFESELGWATSTCNRHFAHYYIRRDGSIYQVADDLIITEHTRASPSLGINNANSIGIELFLNVGEPFDGRQVAALTRLLDFLAERYALDRPQRDANLGIYRRNRMLINAGGDRFVAHVDVDSGKCDPSGTFMDSGFIKPEVAGVRCKDPNDPRVQPVPLSVGATSAPALIDMVTDAVAVLARDRQHTGIINTQGGDAFELGQAGHGGDIQFIEDAAAVVAFVGDEERTRWQENDPNLAGQPANTPIGPGPLIVAPGATTMLTSRARERRDDIREYTDVIVAGTLIINGSVGLALSGSFYVSPIGKIIIREGRHGGSLGVYSRGVPIVQGLIDARGQDGVEASPDGGNGGIVTFTFSHPGILLVPTAYARGGDADFANVLQFDGGPRGGDGGDIIISVGDTHVFLGGGIGSYLPASQTQLPPFWFAGTIEASLFNPNVGARWAGDYLPPTPPTRRYAPGTTWPPPLAYRIPKRTIFVQTGFKRGLLTSGGMGGTGVASSDGNQHGGRAGDGGQVQIHLGSGGVLTFRDADIATGTEIETLSHRFSLPPPAVDGLVHVECTTAGAHGGFGQDLTGAPAGNGGPGGGAGAVTVSGGILEPSPVAFDAIQEIWGFPPDRVTGEPACRRGTEVVGNVIEVLDEEDRPMYRVRVDLSNQQLLGGHGGIPSGRRTGYPGNVGQRGANAPIAGIPVK